MASLSEMFRLKDSLQIIVISHRQYGYLFPSLSIYSDSFEFPQHPQSQPAFDSFWMQLAFYTDRECRPSCNLIRS